MTVAGADDAAGVIVGDEAAGFGFGFAFFGGAFIAGTPTAELSAGTVAPLAERATAGDGAGVDAATGDDFLVANPTANAAPNPTTTATASATHIAVDLPSRAGATAAASLPIVMELI